MYRHPLNKYWKFDEVVIDVQMFGQTGSKGV